MKNQSETFCGLQLEKNNLNNLNLKLSSYFFVFLYQSWTIFLHHLGYLGLPGPTGVGDAPRGDLGVAAGDPGDPASTES